MPTTQEPAWKDPVFPGHLNQSPHYCEWLFRWRHASVQVFLAAGLAWNIKSNGPFRMLLLPRI